jgi:8-oxo-dGTP pyrophosphatase MutT (NUDIX family)
MKYPPLTPWQVLERRPVLRRSFLQIWEERVRLANGSQIDDFCLVEAPDWASVVCITPERQVALVRQYRHGIRKDSLELPAGALEPGEAPLAAAQRELLEETGYASAHWQPLMSASIDPSRQTARAHFYCASGAERASVPRLDASEDLETVFVSRAELLDFIDTGRLAHGIHIAAILMAERRGLL